MCPYNLEVRSKFRSLLDNLGVMVGNQTECFTQPTWAEGSQVKVRFSAMTYYDDKW